MGMTSCRAISAIAYASLGASILSLAYLLSFTARRESLYVSARLKNRAEAGLLEEGKQYSFITGQSRISKANVRQAMKLAAIQGKPCGLEAVL
jgi:hypothetical protein